MKHTIYETVCLINNKRYIGYHATKNPEDDYLGSGKYLKKAIKKYGRENFKKNVLYIFETRDEALGKEREIVNEDFVSNENTYNLKVGGEGGFDYINNEFI